MNFGLKRARWSCLYRNTGLEFSFRMGRQVWAEPADTPPPEFTHLDKLKERVDQEDKNVKNTDYEKALEQESKRVEEEFAKRGIDDDSIRDNLKKLRERQLNEHAEFEKGDKAQKTAVLDGAKKALADFLAPADRMRAAKIARAYDYAWEKSKVRDDGIPDYENVGVLIEEGGKPGSGSAGHDLMMGYLAGIDVNGATHTEADKEFAKFVKAYQESPNEHRWNTAWFGDHYLHDDKVKEMTNLKQFEDVFQGVGFSNRGKGYVLGLLLSAGKIFGDDPSSFDDYKEYVKMILKKIPAGGADGDWEIEMQKFVALETPKERAAKLQQLRLEYQKFQTDVAAVYGEQNGESIADPTLKKAFTTKPNDVRLILEESQSYEDLLKRAKEAAPKDALEFFKKKQGDFQAELTDADSGIKFKVEQLTKANEALGTKKVQPLELGDVAGLEQHINALYDAAKDGSIKDLEGLKGRNVPGIVLEIAALKQTLLTTEKKINAAKAEKEAEDARKRAEEEAKKKAAEEEEARKKAEEEARKRAEEEAKKTPRKGKERAQFTTEDYDKAWDTRTPKESGYHFEDWTGKLRVRSKVGTTYLRDVDNGSWTPAHSGEEMRMAADDKQAITINIRGVSVEFVKVDMAEHYYWVRATDLEKVIERGEPAEKPAPAGGNGAGGKSENGSDKGKEAQDKPADGRSSLEKRAEAFANTHRTMGPIQPDLVDALIRIDQDADGPDGARFVLPFNDKYYRMHVRPDQGGYILSYNGGQIPGVYANKEDVMSAINEGNVQALLMVATLRREKNYEPYENKMGEVHALDFDKKNIYHLEFELDWDTPDPTITIDVNRFGFFEWTVDRKNSGYKNDPEMPEVGRIRKGAAKSLHDFAIQMERIKKWAEGEEHSSSETVAARKELTFDTLTNINNFTRHRDQLGRLDTYEIMENGAVMVGFDWGAAGGMTKVRLVDDPNGNIRFDVGGDKIPAEEKNGTVENFSQLLRRLQTMKERFLPPEQANA